MKVSLKGLPDTLRGVAWPTSACAVGDLLNQVTGETHMYIYYVYYIQIAMVTWMKVWATLGEYSPTALGYTRASMVDTTGCNSEKRSQSLKVHLSPD